jgi:D-arabinose 1-dehydrogenase-like Zn-dependent alcohol dehydrogenase
LRLVETGAIRSWVSDVLPLREAARAHDRLEKKEVAGRLVLEPVH